MTKFYIEVIADTNDADYVTKRTEITEEDVNNLLPIISVIKSQDNDWPTSEYSESSLTEMYIDSDLLSEDDVNLISQYVPYGEEGVHTIKTITLLTVINEIELL